MSNTRLPAAATALLPSTKKSNQETIISFLVSEPGAVILTEEQETLLKRWNHADDLIRGNRYSTKQIIRIMERKYDIAASTAYRDIKATEYVFGTSRKNNKNYLLANHIDLIKEIINVARQRGYIDVLPKLLSAMTNALKLIAEDKQGNTSPTQIIFNISEVNIGKLISETLTPAEAGWEDAEVLAQYEIEDVNEDDDQEEDDQ